MDTYARMPFGFRLACGALGIMCALMAAMSVAYGGWLLWMHAAGHGQDLRRGPLQALLLVILSAPSVWGARYFLRIAKLGFAAIQTRDGAP